MAQNTTITVPPRTWTQLTNSNATNVTVDNFGNDGVLLKGAVGAVPPTDELGALRYDRGQRIVNVTLDHLFLGLAGVNRLYAYHEQGTTITIQHA